MTDTPLFDEIRAERLLDVDDVIPALALAERIDGWCEDRPLHELTDQDGRD